jgi:SM-20-related protein
MPSSDFFRRLGLFVIDDFLDAAECARLRTEIDAASSAPAHLSRRGQDDVLDEDFRRAKLADVSKTTESIVRSRFHDLQPQIAQHFDRPLADREGPQFLVYDTGGFFRAHTDDDSHPTAPDYLKSRFVSLVLFLNGEAREPAEGGYGGGQLTLYGLLEGAHWEKCPLPLKGETGLLIAFRSNLKHEVKPVTFGRRYTIVTWFHSQHDSAELLTP